MEGERLMSAMKRFRLGQLQLKIMKVLWEHGPASVADVQAGLPDGASLAYTTVATMLRKMEGRGLVRHKSEGRRFVYRAAVEPEAVSRTMVDDLIDRVFGGSLTDAVSHLLDIRDVSRDELRELERLIQQRKHHQ
jgi:predicted transcriptional regulator